MSQVKLHPNKGPKLPDGTKDPNPTRDRTFILPDTNATSASPPPSATSGIVSGEGLEADIQDIRDYAAKMGRPMSYEEARSRA